MAKRRKLPSFNLAFLNTMCCALGAIMLLFLIIKHNMDLRETAAANPDTTEVNLLQQQVEAAEQQLAELQQNATQVEAQIATATSTERRLEQQRKQNADQRQSTADDIAALRASVRDLEKKKQELEADLKTQGENPRTFETGGTREYLTGLRLDGQRTLLLFDVSASMLDSTIVNILRRKYMPPAHKLSAPKWRQAIRIVDWMTARLPPDGEYQIYTFNTEVKPVLAGTEGSWLKVSSTAQLDSAVAKLKQTVPDGGTNLENAFRVARQMQPLPDNIILITDGLPTQGGRPPSGTVISGNERQRLFDSAVTQLPKGVPVHVVLCPMEGDPTAAHSFWGLAIMTKGSFMSPAWDWP